MKVTTQRQKQCTLMITQCKLKVFFYVLVRVLQLLLQKPLSQNRFNICIQLITFRACSQHGEVAPLAFHFNKCDCCLANVCSKHAPTLFQNKGHGFLWTLLWYGLIKIWTRSRPQTSKRAQKERASWWGSSWDPSSHALISMIREQTWGTEEVKCHMSIWDN